MFSLVVGSVAIELFVASLMFCTNVGRPAWGRAWPVPAFYVLAALAYAYGPIDVTVQPAATFYFAVIFLVSTATVAWVFSLDPVSALVVGTLGYCTQHLSSDAAFALLGWLFGDGLDGLAFLAGEYLCLAVGYVAIWFAVARGFRMDRSVLARRKSWVIASVATVFFLIVFRLTFAETQTGGIRTAFYVYDGLVTLFLMLTLMLFSRVDRLRADNAAQEAIWQRKRDQYELARDNMELINIKCHDIRKRVRSMGAAQLSESSIEQIRESIRIYDAQVKTGNEALDVILTEKQLLCSQAGIELICMADGAALSFMPEDDVYFLFGNILDNAIEAVLNVVDDEKRSINLTARREGGFVTVREDNYFEGELTFSDGLPRTTKQDRSNHGFGMKSIRRCVYEHGGEMHVRAESGAFSLVLLFPCA